MPALVSVPVPVHEHASLDEDGSVVRVKYVSALATQLVLPLPPRPGESVDVIIGGRSRSRSERNAGAPIHIAVPVVLPPMEDVGSAVSAALSAAVCSSEAPSSRISRTLRCEPPYPTRKNVSASDRPSFAAVVASMDRHLATYHSIVTSQLSRCEVIESMEEMVTRQLRRFYELNGQLAPRRIFFYRDGVGVSQFPIIKQREVAAIRRACVALGGERYRPKPVFGVVQQRNPMVCDL